ncbi:uncharacterized protein B0H64DRAFT_385525 [Chaetomium fimeti]|uniref:Uncharacterized protein n=1 Tax=Chaetomium fimeti TaxID=1854472 RepID=A0AAE0HL72_9PEZI|nr:hypothetical protein B0H64DRAFT_385525 [Chaetomium fimeti]
MDGREPVGVGVGGWLLSGWLLLLLLFLPLGVAMVAMNLGYFLPMLSALLLPWSFPMRPVRTTWRLVRGVDGCCAGMEAGQSRWLVGSLELD